MTCSIVMKRYFPELVSLFLFKFMKTKTLNFEEFKKTFVEFTLSNKEMIHVRGGGEPTVKPCIPPIKI